MKRVCQFIKPYRLGLQRKFYSTPLFTSEKYLSQVAFCRWGWKGRSEVMNCIYMFNFSSVRKNENRCHHSMIIMYSQNHAIDALATQGATTSATMVLTLLSQNKTCKTQTLVYGTCEHLFFLIFNLVVLNLFTKYKNMFTLSVILTIDIALGIFTAYTARSVYELWLLRTRVCKGPEH